MSSSILVMIYLIFGCIILGFVIKQNEEFIPYFTTLAVIISIMVGILLWPLLLTIALINIIYEKATQKVYKETKENNETSGN